MKKADKVIELKDLFQVICLNCKQMEVDLFTEECLDCQSLIIAQCRNCSQKYHYHDFRKIIENKKKEG